MYVYILKVSNQNNNSSEYWSHKYVPDGHNRLATRIYDHFLSSPSKT